MHAADTSLFESGREAAGATTVEADHVDPAGGCDFRGVDAHRLADWDRLGHWAMRGSHKSLNGPYSLRECQHGSADEVLA